MSNHSLIDAAADALSRLRERRPRIHCLTNTVVQKFTADGLTVLGAIPSMTSSADEIADFVRNADGLLVNLGTLDPARKAVISTAVASLGDKPWLVDPVHCDASPLRLDFARLLLASGPTAVRGNHAEMALISAPHGCVAMETGATDVIRLGARQVEIANGHGWMAQVTGTGCLSGAVAVAFLAVEPDPFIAAVAAMLTLGVSAQLAAQHSRGPGTFAPALLDAMAVVAPGDISTLARIEI